MISRIWGFSRVCVPREPTTLLPQICHQRVPPEKSLKISKLQSRGPYIEHQSQHLPRTLPRLTRASQDVIPNPLLELLENTLPKERLESGLTPYPAPIAVMCPLGHPWRTLVLILPDT